MKNILQKCIEELAKESPKLDYIRGMLEVLVEQDSTPPPVTFTPAVNVVKPNMSVNPHGAPDPGMDILSGKTISNG